MSCEHRGFARQRTCGRAEKGFQKCAAMIHDSPQKGGPAKVFGLEDLQI
jgi:hypothetical protein